MANVVERLVEMVGYQKGSVVSRQVLGKEKGNVTLFAFAEGEGLSEHTAPFDAIGYVIDGEAEITISGQSYTVGTGEMIIMPANEPHALKAIKPFKLMLTMIKA
jgi:quercetin dioxygenase-like cupin family protein